MSKVICEICGTAYPVTENECPVCGFEKPENPEIAPDTGLDAVDEAASVKGGRFSKSNVSKKQKAAPANVAAKPKAKKKSKQSDKGLIIAIIVLLLAIIVTTGYIYFTYFAPQDKPAVNNPPVQTTTEPSKETLPPQTEGTTEAEDLSCSALTLYEQYVTFNKAGSQWLLNVVPTPANTTDTITFSSADQNIATVDAEGYITAVADGETTITITCGEISVECKVICELAPEDTTPEETEPAETEPQETEPEETEPEETKPEETKPQDTGDFKLRKTDITFDGKGQTYKLYDGDIDVTKIVWSVGNTSVATVKDGVVKAVGPGLTNVYAEYNGVKISCIIRCDF